jgi:hypothetical protein
MKKELVFVLGLSLMIFLTNGVNAITGAIGGSHIIINTTNGEMIVKSFSVMNINQEPVRINLSKGADLYGEINLLEEEFILDPNESREVFFIIKVNHTGVSESQIIVGFHSLNDSEGVQLGVNIIVNAEENDHEQRLSALESWKETIITTLSNIWNSINTLISENDEQDTEIDDLKNRVRELENQTPIIINETLPNYFKYLSSSDRKKMVCGYAEDNHLTQLTDLGWNCTITYRQSSSGEKSSCKCKKIE